MPFDIYHPCCIIKIILYASTSPVDPFKIYEQVDSTWFDCVEPHAAAAVIQKLNVKQLGGYRMHHRRGPVGFLNEAKLKSFDVRPFWFCSQIRTRFLIRAQSLKSVDFSGNVMENVKSIGSFFLYGCTALQEIDFECFKKVEKVELYFMGGCRNLTRIKNLSCLGQSLVKIDSYFLTECDSLTELDFSHSFSKVEVIEGHFLSACQNLKEVKFFKEDEEEAVAENENRTSHNNDDDDDNNNLPQTNSGIVSSGLGVSVREIRDGYFMYKCSSLKEIRLNLPNLRIFHAKQFLECCTALEVIDLSRMNRSCDELTKVKLWSAPEEFRKDHYLMEPHYFQSPKIFFLFEAQYNGNLKKFVVPREIWDSICSDSRGDLGKIAQIV